MPATLDRTAQTSSRVTGWDFAAIGLLALVGFALSYDALRQTAIAIHVRGPLTYLFPLIIDGFIAYSVRALLILRIAPLTARAYVWLLFGASTTASIWANVLHAVRLNQQTLAVTGQLYLSDVSVGVLSAVAPLALAGSVHLGIITARHTHPTAARTGDPSPVEETVRAVSETAGGLRPAEHGSVPAQLPTSEPRESGVGQTTPERPAARSRSAAAEDLPWTVPGSRGHARTEDTVPDEPAGQRPSGNTAQPPTAKPAGRPPGASLDELAAIGLQAWTDARKLSRSVVRDAIRERGLTISDQRLTEVMKMLRPDDEPHQPTAAD
ncbi:MULTISPECIES: DUF2637 domain-containing protein [unclassified Kitasatospora]|uniref:DUF2637 domain-containing protein n=1 Tax=unclassified Kitasatospora TaxID=2633591 RepID=UPI0033F02DAE